MDEGTMRNMPPFQEIYGPDTGDRGQGGEDPLPGTGTSPIPTNLPGLGGTDPGIGVGPSPPGVGGTGVPTGPDVGPAGGPAGTGGNFDIPEGFGSGGGYT